MKKQIIIILVVCITGFINNSIAKNVRFYWNWAVFNSPEQGPFVETYISIAANSINYAKNENGKFQGNLEMLLMFKQKGAIINFSKEILLSPERDDTLDLKFAIIYQKRFLLPNGAYELEIQVDDKNDNNTAKSFIDSVFIEIPNDKISISNIQRIESYATNDKLSAMSKSGMELMPYISNFYPTNTNKLQYYFEIYNADKVLGKDEKYLVNFFVESHETKQVIASLSKIRRESAKNVSAFLQEFDITELPSGNYNIIIEVRDKNNQLLASQSEFIQRSNKAINPTLNINENIDLALTFVNNINNIDTLVEYVNCLFPISSELERAMAEGFVKERNFEQLKKYFYHFWTTRDKLAPEIAWNKYKSEVDKVNANYSTRIRKGYLTDRGRVYLVYGPPNTISQNPSEPNSYPYEIWHYYQLNNQRNKKFVFCNFNLALNDYELIHSDAIGEISDYNWEFKLHGRNAMPAGVDEDRYIDSYGDKAKDRYRNPR